jgi:Ca-activated chloride channel homolog
MRKLFVSLLVSVMLSSLAVVAYSQGRPRRVGENNNQQPTLSTPKRPPVLGGANRPPGQQPTQSQVPEQTGPEEVDAGDIIRVNTTLVTLPVSVMDRDGRYVPNLSKEDFRVWEDGIEQQVGFFASVEKPFSVVLMLDTSPSTQFRLEDIQDAAITFVNQLRPDDKVMVVSFNDEIKILSELTNDRGKLRRAIERAYTGDGTRLYDAIEAVMNQQLSRMSGRKAIVLFTDGVDTTSRRASYQSTVMDAQELDALIYPVQYNTLADVANGLPQAGHIPDVWGRILGGIFGGGRRSNRRGGGGWPGGRGPQGDYDLADQYLRELATSTGGRGYQADSLQNMASAFANVAEELRRQYSIGYYPKRPPQPGQRREIRVRTNQPNLAVRTRDSYIFGSSKTAQAQTSSGSSNPPVLRRLTEQE